MVDNRAEQQVQWFLFRGRVLCPIKKPPPYDGRDENVNLLKMHILNSFLKNVVDLK